MIRSVVGAVGLVGSLLLAASPAAAQIGVRGGANISTVSVDPPDSLGVVSDKTGFLAGAYITFFQQGKLDVEVGGHLSVRRVTFDEIYLDTLTYLEGPVVARCSLFKTDAMTFRGVGGVSFNYLLGGNESIDGGESYSIKAGYKSFDTAAVAGAQVEWGRHWTIDVRYLFGLSETYPEPVEGVSSRQHGWQFMAGYKFR